MYIYLYICMYIYIYESVYMYVCIYVCIYIYMYLYTCMYIHICICIYVCIFIYVSVYIYVYIYICICIYVCLYIYVVRGSQTHQWGLSLQGGEDAQDALSLYVIFRKRALELVALLPKMTCNLRHPMGLYYLVMPLAPNVLSWCCITFVYVCTYLYTDIYSYVSVCVCTREVRRRQSVLMFLNFCICVHIFVYWYVFICKRVCMHTWGTKEQINIEALINESVFASWDLFWGMGWLRSVGSIKL